MFLKYKHYDVRFSEINSNIIFNLIPPPNEEYIKIKNKTENFYINLEASILEKGFENPILITAGIQGSPNTIKNKHKLPPSFLNNIENIIVCDRLGGSRLWVAQKHGLKIPCIICDYINKFPNEEKLKTIDQVYDKFTIEPARITADNYGLHVFGMDYNAMTQPTYAIKYDVINPLLINNNIEPSENDMTQRTEWFEKLEQSIKKDGIRNPIIVTARIDNGIKSITPRYGGSRLMIAQKYSIWIPCIIADFNHVFPSAKLITTSKDAFAPLLIEKYFKDKPKKIIIKPHGINVSGCPDIHME